MADWAIVALGIPVGVCGLFFSWLFSRQYLKLLLKRQDLRQQELLLKERELTLREKQVDHEFEFQERELDYKFKALELESDKLA